MVRPFRVRDIAVQAGLSPATVDRVLHGRPGVRASTVSDVERAVAELERQRGQLRAAGRTWVVDVVVAAPERFGAAVRVAAEAELAGLRPVVVRVRSSIPPGASEPLVLAALERAGRTRSDGVVLKAEDTPAVREAVAALTGAGVPVVTLVTDLPGSRRTAYVGLDNDAAGATAAYLLTRWAPLRPPRADDAGPGPLEDVLVVRSASSFRGEDERAAGFARTLARLAPGARAREVVDEGPARAAGGGAAPELRGRVRAALRAHPGLAAVYSLYAGPGGNAAVLAAFGDEHRPVAVFVAHDLDAENAPLLARGALSAVLHHDLRADARSALRAVLQSHGVLPGPVRSRPAQVQVVTPFNVPTGLRG